MDEDCSFSETDDGLQQHSLSLVSYGSEAAESSFEVSNLNLDDVPNSTMVDLKLSDSHQSMVLPEAETDEKEILLSVAKQLGFSGMTSEKLDEINSALEKMRASQRKYIQNKMLFDAVVSVAKTPSALPNPTAHRVNQVLQRISVLDCITSSDEVNKENSGGEIFGITKEDIDGYFPQELTSFDKKHLRDAVAKELSAKHQNLVQLDKRHSDLLEKLSGPEVTRNHSVENSDTQVLLSLRHDLECEIAKNVSYIKELDKVLCEFAKLKLENVHCLNCDKLDHLSSQCEALKQQIRSLNLQVIQGTYQEDKHLIDAYTKLKQTLDLAVDEAKNELRQLQRKEADYEKLSGTHFDKLVQEFNHLQDQIAQKEYALKNLV